MPGAEAVRHIHKGQEYKHPDSFGADHSYTMKLLCLDLASGKMLWDRTVYEGRVYDNRHRKNTYASETPQRMVSTFTCRSKGRYLLLRL